MAGHMDLMTLLFLNYIKLFVVHYFTFFGKNHRHKLPNKSLGRGGVKVTHIVVQSL